MHQELLQQLDSAVAEVFQQMLGHGCAPTTHCLCLAAEDGFTACVIFSGSLEGACTIHLDLQGAGELTDALIGEPTPVGSELPADTVGELCNMIAGSWKSRLAPHLAACLLSSPSVCPAGRLEGEAEPVRRYYHFGKHCLTLQLTLP